MILPPNRLSARVGRCSRKNHSGASGIMRRMLFTTTGRKYMAYQRGDVLLVPFPFSDLSATKVRPAIVVSSHLYHNTEPDLLLAGITSNTIVLNADLDYVLQ